MSSIGQRIKSEREAQGISRTDLSKKTGIGYSTLAELENGRMQSSTRLHVIADALGVLASYLETGKEPKRPTSQPYPLSEGDSGFLISESKAPYLRQISTWDNPDELPADQFVFLPHLDAYLSAGHGGPSTDAIETSDKTTPFRSDWVKSEGWNPRTHYTMRCKGDSMEPTIQDGAPVVIDTSASGKRVQSGRIYAISVDGETYLKRLDKLPNGMVRVRSDNATPMYAPYELAESAINIIGRAVWTPVRL